MRTSARLPLSEEDVPLPHSLGYDERVCCGPPPAGLPSSVHTGSSGSTGSNSAKLAFASVRGRGRVLSGSQQSRFTRLSSRHACEWSRQDRRVYIQASCANRLRSEREGEFRHICPSLARGMSCLWRARCHPRGCRGAVWHAHIIDATGASHSSVLSGP